MKGAYEFDADYIARLVAGDSEICNHFAEYFTRVLDAILAVRVWDPDRARDIRQKVLLQVLINLHRDGGVERPERFPAYVMGVCRNKLREEIRDWERHAQALECDPPAGGRSIEDELVTAQYKECVATVLNEMREPDRQIIRIIYLDEVEREEACRRLGIRRDVLRVRLHRAACRFQELYRKRYGSGR